MPEPRPAERGQAAVELVALLPLIAVVLLAGWQLVLAGHAAWSAAGAARAGARAAALGRDARQAARAVAPDARVRVLDDGAVEVRVPSPFGALTAHSSFEAQR